MAKRPSASMALLGIAIGSWSGLATSQALHAAGCPSYDFVELPALQTPAGTLAVLEAEDLNELGQVTGRARSDLAAAAFRYTPGAGMQDLDPGGRYRNSVGMAINDRGQVFVVENQQQGRIFLYSDGSGFDPLRRGFSKAQRVAFRLRDLNDHGDIVGRTGHSDRSEPVLYMAGSGWRSLRSLVPELAGHHGVGELINDRLDVVVTASPEDLPIQEDDLRAFVLLEGTRVEEIDRFGADSALPRFLDDRGAVAGQSFGDGASRAFVFFPDSGTRNLHPRGYRSSRAFRVNGDAAVAVSAFRRRTERAALFWYREEAGLERAWGPAAVRRLKRRSGVTRRAALSIGPANERREVVGKLIPSGAGSSVSFLHRPGLRNFCPLQEIVDHAPGGAGFLVLDPVDLSDRGQILVQGARDHGDAVAVLIPLD